MLQHRVIKGLPLALETIPDPRLCQLELAVGGNSKVSRPQPGGGGGGVGCGNSSVGKSSGPEFKTLESMSPWWRVSRF